MFSKSKIQVFVLIVVFSAICLQAVCGRPYQAHSRPNSSDDEDEDDIVEESVDEPRAAEMHQTDGSNADADGYEEPEPDEKYEETPQESENQAELERFFDDHLGASDKDGMDKENLPTNAIPYILTNPTVTIESDLKNYRLISNGIDRHDNYQPADSPEDNFYSTNPYMDNSVADNMYQQSTQNIPLSRQRMMARNIKNNNNKNNKRRNDNDDVEKVYITSINKEPFTIDQLGGYNPEADFKGLSNDLENSNSDPSPSDASEDEDEGSSAEEPDIDRRQDGEGGRDIDFNNRDDDDDAFDNNATGTDDAAFETDDPYINDRIEQSQQMNSYSPKNIQWPGKPSSASSTPDGRQQTANY